MFSPAEAIGYLKKIIQRNAYNETEEKALKDLSLDLGYLPLALGQAGAYIKKQMITVADYLGDYRKQSMSILAEDTQPLDSNSKPVALTWNISLEAIKKDEQKDAQSGLSLMVLQVMAHLHPEGIPRSLLQCWLQVSGAAKDQQGAKSLLGKIIGHLVDYSMIEVQPHKQTVSLHRLVQLVMRNQQKQKISSHPVDEKSRSSEAEVTINPYPSFLKTLTDSLETEFNRETTVLEDEAREYALFPHLQQMVLHYDAIASEFKSQPVELASLLQAMGNVFSEQGDAKQAQTSYEQSLAIKEKHYGQDHPKTAKTLVNLGNAYGELGDAQRQKELQERALVIEEKHYGRDHLEPRKR